MKKPLNTTHTHSSNFVKTHCALPNNNASVVFMNELAKVEPVEIKQELVQSPVVTGTLTFRDFCANSFYNQEVLKNYDTPKELKLDLFEGVTITHYDDSLLRRLMSEVLIRFDTDPKNLLKDDFAALLNLILHTTVTSALDFNIDSITEPDIDALFQDD